MPSASRHACCWRHRSRQAYTRHVVPACDGTGSPPLSTATRGSLAMSSGFSRAGASATSRKPRRRRSRSSGSFPSVRIRRKGSMRPRNRLQSVTVRVTFHSKRARSPRHAAARRGSSRQSDKSIRRLRQPYGSASSAPDLHARNDAFAGSLPGVMRDISRRASMSTDQAFRAAVRWPQPC